MVYDNSMKNDVYTLWYNDNSIKNDFIRYGIMLTQ